MATNSGNRHRVIIVGAGFGGLEIANRLAKTDLEITLIDRRNYHLFQPLLYQVAGSSLSNSEIAWPVPYLFRKRPYVKTLMAAVETIDKSARQAVLDDGARLAYDKLALATGATHAYFGHDEWEQFAAGLKTLEDDNRIRRRILKFFEDAERTSDPELRTALQNFVIIGGGPTGVELAGTIAELARNILTRDFRAINPRQARIVLIETGPRLLPVFPESLSDYTKQALEKLNVEVRLGTPVTNCSANGITYGDKQFPAKTIIWATGVQASPAARWLRADANRAGRVIVGPDLTLAGHKEMFVIGDTAAVTMENGKTVPGVAPAAKQQGQYVARLITSRLGGKTDAPAFIYHHQGNMTTIGRSLAVVDMGKVRLRGPLAWWMWKLVHIYFLIGARNRLSVAISWMWNHSVGYRGARLIMVPNHRIDS